MPTIAYKNNDGTRVPGTTTVIGASLGWNKNQLMWWAWSQGKEGKNFRETSDKACDAGTLAHAMCEAEITGKLLKDIVTKPYDKNTENLAKKAFDAYLRWQAMSRVEFIDSEISLVSEKYQYGGTIDAIGQYEDKYYLVDFKTSNGTYADHLVQLAAYENLIVENEVVPSIDGYELLRFSKENADFHHASYTDLNDAWLVFKNLRELYNLKKPLEKRAA